MNASLIKRIAGLIPVAGILFLAGCTDEINSPLDGSGKRITFDVADTEAWSRSGDAYITETAGGLSTVILRAGNEHLYLIPEVTKTPLAAGTSGSRGEAVTSSSIESFGVYASGVSDAAYYMENVEVTRDNDWAPRKEYQWPGIGSLHITAYSPYRSMAETSGVTALPSANPSEAPMLGYSVPDDVTAQTDLLRAKPKDASASPCALNFSHALAGVRFVTGAEMRPCTVTSISISGVSESGQLNLESGVWTDVVGSKAFTSTQKAVLEAEAGSDYVADGTAISDDEHTFRLLPQTLGEDASVTLTIDYDGAPITFTASLAGQTWSAGNTYTYRLSANPELDRFIISATTPLEFNYTGGTLPFSVNSRHEKIVDGVVSTQDVPWTAEFVDANGNPTDAPAWVSDIPLSGKGKEDLEASTRMVYPDFVSMSEPTRKLRAASPVGSATVPYNLSNSTGAAGVENTANCYIINAPGTYSIPLVYGNAIKNGADNRNAYMPTRSREPFVNHLGKRITKPYIYDNSGCEHPKDAVLMWEGRLNLVQNVRLSDDGKSIVFDIPAEYIRQGNAMVALRDANGDVMWSWQLWITDYAAGEDMISMSYSGKSFRLMPLNLGQIMGGDETDFPSETAYLRLTQKPDDGNAGESVTVKISQTGKHVITPDCHSFYQWGRKDPMISGIKEWYNADHTEITQIDTRIMDTTDGTVGDEFESELIKTPATMWIIAMSGNPTFKYNTHWNTGSASSPHKTIYDPCPAGYMVPGNELMLFFYATDSDFSFHPYGGFSDPAQIIYSAGGTKVSFPTLGYRSGKSGEETLTSNDAEMTALWTSHTNSHEAKALVLSNENPLRHALLDEARLEAFGIRPIAE
ncbi:MAG: fimbrillin family protein [Muribaculaceae bacterium]|nr:fimbrillin family protein [Muribaculaceae bacterium]